LERRNGTGKTFSYSRSLFFKGALRYPEAFFPLLHHLQTSYAITQLSAELHQHRAGKIPSLKSLRHHPTTMIETREGRRGKRKEEKRACVSFSLRNASGNPGVNKKQKLTKLIQFKNNIDTTIERNHTEG
jgi:hypothetical protein